MTCVGHAPRRLKPRLCRDATRLAAAADNAADDEHRDYRRGNFNGIYPAFQDIEISGNTIQSLSGPGLCMAGVENAHTPKSTAGVFRNQFVSCPAVPATDPLRPYFGSHSTSTVDLSFAHGVALAGKQAHPTCAARYDYSSCSEVTDQAR
jgi:hypothetical protein